MSEVIKILVGLLFECSVYRTKVLMDICVSQPTINISTPSSYNYLWKRL